MSLKDLLIELLNPRIPSGSEPRENKGVQDVFRGFCDEVNSDPLGNIIGIKKGETGRGKVMLAAHMDEIALMVNYIDDKGFLGFTSIGGVDERILPGQRVVVHGDQDYIGIIGTKPPHIQTPQERRRVEKTTNLFVDLGLPVEKIRKHVQVGNYITFERKPQELLNDRWSSNALDDRAGLAAVLWALKELDRLRFDLDVYAVATSQEEVGLRGAIVSSFSVNPDIGIAIDVCHADMPEVPDHDTQKLSQGPVITLGPNIHPRLFNRIKEVAENNNIPYQVLPEPGATGTDAWAMQIAGEGIPTALISIPLRYMHTTVETVCLEDIKKCGRLIACFVASLNMNFVEELRCF